MQKVTAINGEIFNIGDTARSKGSKTWHQISSIQVRQKQISRTLYDGIDRIWLNWEENAGGNWLEDTEKWRPLLKPSLHSKFLDWLDTQEIAPYRVMFDTIPVAVQVGYILDWLESIDVVLDLEYERYSNQYYSKIINKTKGIRVDCSGNFKTRLEATIESIKKVNEVV